MKNRVLYALLLTLFSITLFASLSRAAIYDPKLHFRTVETDHFAIHFPDSLVQSATRLAVIAEEVHSALSVKLDWKPWGRTQIVLVDSSDNPNGLTNVLPYNNIMLYLAPPRADSSLFNYNDYLTLLFTHEYTHVLHIDAYGGTVTPLHWIFGKIIVPNAAVPGWVREGWAAFHESDEARYGRANSAYTNMVLRADLMDGKFLPIDRADGVHHSWPGASTQYLYGSAFWKWLIETEGKAKVDRFFHIQRSSLMFFVLDMHARKAFGKSFVQLWKEWQSNLTADLNRLKQKLGPVTSTIPFITEKQSAYFTWAPNGKDYAVYTRSIDVGPRIVTSAASKKDKKKLKGIDVSGQLSFSKDGSRLAYSAFERKSYTYYSQLFTYDLKNAKHQTLIGPDKKPLRGFDPDFSQEGDSLIYVCRAAEQESLCRYEFKEKTNTTVIAGRNGEQFFNPRYSPDGKTVAVTRLSQGNFDLLLVNPHTGESKSILASKYHLLYPTWNPNGTSITYSSDESGIYNLYTLDTKTGHTQKLTTTLTGLFQPTYAPDGKLYAQVYTEKGFEIHEVIGELEQGGQGGFEASTADTAKAPTNTPSPSFESRPYSPFKPSLFLPRYLLPVWAITDADALFGVQTGSADPLYRHLWTAGVHYRTGPGFVGFNGAYSYNRFKPVFTASFNRYSVNFGDVFGIGSDFYEARSRAAFNVGYSYKQNHFSTHYFFEDRSAYNQQNQNISALNLGHYAGIGVNYLYSSIKRYPASISEEKGSRLNLSFDASDASLGAAEKNEQRVFVGDMRQFFKVPGTRHHVIALRGTGGITFGDTFIQRTFVLGGGLGDSPLTSASRRTFSLRGVPFATFGGERAMVFSLEYRLPLVTVERGFRNLPIFLNRAHLGFFADYGDIWNRNQNRDLDNFFDNFMLGTGVELRGDFVLGHGLPVTGRLGYGILVVNRNRVSGLSADTTGSDVEYGTLILELGTSF